MSSMNHHPPQKSLLSKLSIILLFGQASATWQLPPNGGRFFYSDLRADENVQDGVEKHFIDFTVGSNNKVLSLAINTGAQNLGLMSYYCKRNG